MRLFGRSVATGLGTGLGLLMLGAAAVCGVGVANDVATQPSRTAAAVEATYAPTWQALNTMLAKNRAENSEWILRYRSTLTARTPSRSTPQPR
jgi:hypothetical protein